MASNLIPPLLHPVLSGRNIRRLSGFYAISRQLSAKNTPAVNGDIRETF